MKFDIDALEQGVHQGDRASLARAITLAESRRLEHEEAAQELLQRLLPSTGRSTRLGISGPPGVGKSTLIDELGTQLIDQGHRLAVLAVDPSSGRSGGSILGDKTRMHRLASNQGAFIRPSPSDTTLGGIARRTREAMLLCEAAGFDLILVETVGVGQSEHAVEKLVDAFLVLMLPGAGDELQGIKRGIMELGDVFAINKADGEGLANARKAKQQVDAALHYLRPKISDWSPPVALVSALKGEGIETLWSHILGFVDHLKKRGEFQARRESQSLEWMWSILRDLLEERFRRHPDVGAKMDGIGNQVREGKLTPIQGARTLLRAFQAE